jgi:hypothetical protein
MRTPTGVGPLAALLIALGGLGCASQEAGMGANTPRWEGALMQSFADDIAPKALGLPQDVKNPNTDPALRQRTLSAEVVARVRVQTVSVERRSNGDPVFRIGLQVAVPRLVEREDLGETIEVLIVPGGAAHGLARAWDVRLQGKTFVGFFRRFPGPEGETVIHFHLAPDEAEVAAAVQQIVALDEVKGS